MWALYDQIVVSGSNFIVMLVMARTLSLEAFGLVSLAYTSTLFLNNHQRAFFTQPLNVIGANEAQDSQAKRVSALLMMHLLWTPVAILLIVGAGYFFYPQPLLIATVCFYVATSQLQEFLRRVWYTEGMSTKAFVNDAVSYLGQCGLLGILYASKYLSAESAFLAMGFSSLVAVAINPLQGMRLCRSTIREVKAYALEHWLYGRWLVFGVFVIWGGTQLYPFMLSKSDLAAVGALAACRSLLNAVGVFMQAINSYLPSQARKMLKTAGYQNYGKYFCKLGAKLALLSGAFCVLVFLFAPQILVLVYGEKYMHAGTVMRILAFATFVLSITAVPTNALIALGKTREIFVGNLFSTIFSVSGGLWLVQAGGTEGAAAGILIALTISFVVQTMGLRTAIMNNAGLKDE